MPVDRWVIPVEDIGLAELREVHMLADLLCHLGAEPSRCGMPAHDALALHTASLAAPAQPASAGKSDPVFILAAIKSRILELLLYSWVVGNSGHCE